MRLSRAAEFSGMDLSIQFVVQIWYGTVSNEPALLPHKLLTSNELNKEKKVFPRALKIYHRTQFI